MNMNKKLNILIGGVPFDGKNVGDEAILECTVKSIRELNPSVSISVSTADRVNAERKLGVKTMPLFGFGAPLDISLLRNSLEAVDIFFWAGATGLSTYPEDSIKIMNIAQASRRTTIVWSVGMSKELNPVKYKVCEGRRKTILKLIQAATFGFLDTIAIQERFWDWKIRKKIKNCLAKADLVTVRDEQSRCELMRCGLESDIIVGADPAIELLPASFEKIDLQPEVKHLLTSPIKKVAVCISAQRKIQDEKQLINLLDHMIVALNTHLIFIPFNWETDYELMTRLRTLLKYPDRTVVVAGRYEPAEILRVMSVCDLAIASRLHALIFASIVNVPFIGISRESKIDNFLSLFGLEAAGTVENCNFEKISQEAERLLSDREKKAFAILSNKIHAELLHRLAIAKEILRHILNP